MSIIATAVKHLMAAGITGDALLSAIEELEAEIRMEPKPKSAGAIRQARYVERKRHSASQMTENDVGDENDGGKNEALFIVTPVSPKGDTAPKGAKRTRGSRISPDWKPPLPSELSPQAKALAEQWPKASYEAEAEAFVNYWLGETGAKASKANWHTTWANRVVQIHSKVMRDAKFGNGPAPPPRHAEQSSHLDHLFSKQTAGAAR